jgi:hypothetical protein
VGLGQVFQSSQEMLAAFEINLKQTNTAISLIVFNVCIDSIDEKVNDLDCFINGVVCGLPRCGGVKHVVMKSSATFLHAVAGKQD